jgi:hypothetical protein
MSTTPFPFPGQPQTRRLTTGRLYFNPAGAPGLVDMGNVVKFQRQDKRDTIEHYASRGGVRMVDAEIVHTLKYAYRFTLDEYTDTLAALLQNTAPVTPAGNTPAPAPASPVSLGPVRRGFTYDLGAVGLAAVAVSNVTTGKPLTPGLDVAVDLIAGKLSVIGSGAVSDGDTLSAALTAGPVAVYRAYASGTVPTAAGAFSFYETDQGNPAPRAIHTFTGSATVQNESEEQTTGFRTVDLMVVCTSAPLVMERS